MNATTANPRRPRGLASAFVLLEVTLAMMIISIVVVVALRGFITAMNGVRELRINMTASLLADSLLDDFELEPPTRGRNEGNFADDPRFGEEFEHYFYYWEVRELEQRYDRMPRTVFQDLEPIYEMTLEIVYDDGYARRYTPFETTTYLLDTQLFSDQAIVENQIF